MKKKVILFLVFTAFCLFVMPVMAQEELEELEMMEEASDEVVEASKGDIYEEYTIGIDDILEINVIQPEKISNTVTVSPDGFIFFPYIGGLNVKGLTLREIQEEVMEKLSDGYMKYPVVFVSLLDSRSRKFFVYGEVKKPGTYQLDPNTTVLRAISMAGGFTKFGSSSKVRILRPRGDQPGYNNIRIKIKRVMVGDPEADMLLKSGDIIVISEGIF